MLGLLDPAGKTGHLLHLLLDAEHCCLSKGGQHSVLVHMPTKHRRSFCRIGQWTLA